MSLDPKTVKALDPGIRQVVVSLNDAGIQTAESCEGGEGHAYEKPTVVLTGATADGWRAFAVCLDLGFPVQSLARTWDIENDEPRGPWWHVTFSSTVEMFA
ncbi:MAG: hypothetical protein V3U46_10270 [Acidimicrobiia bacterium]